MQWQFCDINESGRLSKLLEPSKFEEIVERVKRIEPHRYRPQLADDNQPYCRAIYCINIGLELFDAFFNSQCGYRAAYYRSPADGLNANRYLFESMTPVLLDWTRANFAEADIHFIKRSLSLPSAKAWVVEKALKICDECGEWSTSTASEGEIRNGRWEIENWPNSHGRQAYRFECIALFGAFVDGTGEEWVAPRKLCRSHEIWASGWT
jgi:hypothetical protein